MEPQGQSFIQSKGWLKPYYACPERLEQAPTALEPRSPNIKGARPSRPEKRQEEVRINSVPIMLPPSWGKLLLEAAEKRGQEITLGENPVGLEKAKYALLAPRKSIRPHRKQFRENLKQTR